MGVLQVGRKKEERVGGPSSVRGLYNNAWKTDSSDLLLAVMATKSKWDLEGREMIGLSGGELVFWREGGVEGGSGMVGDQCPCCTS